MALFGQAKTDDVATLIARKNYSKAIEVIRSQLKSGKPNPRLRMQLADVLILAGKGKEAVMILTPLADEFAKEGFAAQAIAVLKKIQKVDPGRREVDAKLATLIQTKQRHATVSLPPPSPSLEIGIEVIGAEPLPGGAELGMEAGPELEMEAGPELGFEAAVAIQPPRRPTPPAPKPAAAPRPTAPPPPQPAPVVDRDLLMEEEGEPLLLEPAEEATPFALEPEPLPLEPEPEPAAAEAPVLTLEPEATVEPEILLEPEAEALPEMELLPEAEPELEPEPVADPMSDAAFADELMSVLESAFPGGEAEAALEPETDAEEAAAGSAQIVVSPLFKDFSVDEMVAVIQGLNLLSFEAGNIIITEGDPGNSLYMLTSGRVKCFKKNPQGRQVLLGELDEGAFFGEMSILTGKPRSATVVASTPCELLELDRPTLDGITQQQPHVREVLQRFCDERLKKKA